MSTFKNFVQCRVTTPFSALADSIGLYDVVPPYSLPSEEGGLLVLTDSPNNPSKLEVISYTSLSDLALYGVTRGLEGTTAQDWTGPVYCYQSLLAGEFKTLLDSKVDKITGKGLSDTNFTQDEKTKLAGMDTALAGKADKTTQVIAGTGLTGGGTLASNRTLNVSYGSEAGTATQGNDSRVVNAASNATVNAKEAALETKKADKEITITAGTGLTGGGTLAANRTLNVSYGTTAGTAAQGNDSRLSDSREWTATSISQAEAEAGTATTRRAFTAQRVRQAIVAWFNGISGGLGRTILTRTTAAQVQSDIGLGTAATRDVVTSHNDITAGRMMQVGSGGLFGDVIPPNISATHLEGAVSNGVYRIIGAIASPEAPFDYGTMFSFSYTPDVANRQNQLAISNQGAQMAFRATVTSRQWLYTYHTGNTTKNPDGTLKASSPVINLYTDKHDLHNESQFGATPTVVRKSKGVYEITGTLGLRSEGWYLDTPSDRNGNKYFNIEWTQNITPDAVDGVVDEYLDDIIVTIETFERVWNKDTGMFDNGEPIDINDLQGRFVQLRFNEIKVEQEELNDDSN